MNHPYSLLFCLTAFLTLLTDPALGQEVERDHDVFRVFPYLVSPTDSSVVLNWFTESTDRGYVKLKSQQCLEESLDLSSDPQPEEILSYSDAEMEDSSEFPDMFANANYKHSVQLADLEPGCQYSYTVSQSNRTYEAQFSTPPVANSDDSIRFITFADSETDMNGRSTHRFWMPGAQAPQSTGRPDSIDTYLLTEAEGFQRNLEVISERSPNFLLLSGDIVQGGGYQRAWDEFFFHTAGKFSNVLSSVPILPAIGNWENTGGAYGGYDPEAVARGRGKFQAYFDAPPNNNSNYRGFYYRIDYGPITMLTLDSSNGLPDSTDQDTNINLNDATYPGSDLPDINPGSDQWRWVEAQLSDARMNEQVIFVQFHHPPYTSGWHSLPLTLEGSSGQSGVPMKAYTPLFKTYGVVAVFSGHNESFERSIVDGIHFYDVGVAGDGFGFPLDSGNRQYSWWDDFLSNAPRVERIAHEFNNPYREWVAHHDAPEKWSGSQLVDGGKHYGHLEVNVKPRSGREYEIRLTPVYVFPITDADGMVVGSERRIYEDEVTIRYDSSTGAVVGGE
jgi:hypothetical protein